MPSDSYPYAVGRIRGLERSFLDQAAFHRLSEQPFAAAVKSLADSGYGQEAENKSDPDVLIAAEMDSLRDLMEELTPNPALTDLFWLEQDAINLKLLLKARLLGDEVDDSEFAYGLFDIETLKEAVETKNYSALPAQLAAEMDGVERLIEDRGITGGIDPLTVSAEVDRAVYNYVLYSLKPRLKNLKTSFVKKYFTAKIDFTNMLSLFRARALKWDKARYETVFVDGGEVSKKDLLEAFDLPADNIERAVSFGSLDAPMKRALNAYINEGGSVPAASAVFDDALMDIAAGERFDPFGIGPVIYYLLRKMDEGKKLRVLFARKRASEARLA